MRSIDDAPSERGRKCGVDEWEIRGESALDGIPGEVPRLRRDQRNCEFVGFGAERVEDSFRMAMRAVKNEREVPSMILGNVQQSFALQLKTMQPGN